jgi:hypothetical protein
MRKSEDFVEKSNKALCQLKMDILHILPVENSCGKVCGDCGKV